jgi:hypothetical protein
MIANYSVLKAWRKSQTFSGLHWFSIIIFMILSFLSTINIGFAIGGCILFFMVTALPRIGSIIKYFLISFLITSLLTFIFPPLGVVCAVICILLKIGYLIENWRALLAGLIIYIYPILLSLINSKDFSYENYTGSIIIALISGLGFHLLLTWLYNNKFSTESALGTMGASPLIIFLMILPFILHAIIHDFQSTFHGGHDFNSFETNYHHVNPHHVDGYERSNGTHVSGYWRGGTDGYSQTNPDGIESNNLSYKGK